ncbi:hypothetical protein M3D92_03375 [Micrococcus terreus]|uniref:hypothetical protein n=1 Tax=Micrococcus terreus TaxID=574650 RepID=UPI0021A59A12|nr:hypothetical protein [Micrococcus terreus]MCT2088342.1 hypothetical protein [Micrococcus terreus]
MREIIYPTVHATDVQTVVDAGGTITEKFRQIVGRWEAFAENDYSVTEALHAAILDPGTSAERLAELRVLAEAATTATPVAEATVRNGAAAEVLAALRVEYRSVAASNYEAVRSKFNAKADELVKALETIDAEASAEEVVKAPAKTRAAWAEGPALAVELDELVNVLHTAAILAGKTEPTGHHNSCLIGLTVNAQGLHRRRVWEAWANTSGRGGRWRELWKLGATIEAPALEDAGPYREPAPMEVRTEHTGLGLRQWDHDPEDDARGGPTRRSSNNAKLEGVEMFDHVEPSATAVRIA